MANHKTPGFWAEFRAFATRGNVLDMAVGVIVATAFGKITASLVKDIFMPLFGYLFGGIDLAQWEIILRPATVVDGVQTVAPIVLGLGLFLSAIVDFILIALAIFVFVKVVNTLKRKAEALGKTAEATEAAETVSPQVLLLTEIRDLLEEQKNHG